MNKFNLRLHEVFMTILSIVGLAFAVLFVLVFILRVFWYF